LTPLNNVLIEWYQNNKRDLSIRKTHNPYKIWLSEVILQQTRMDQGIPYYDRFVKAFPNVKSLALADEKEVLRLWQGLGYYSRARNLHKTAKIISNDFDGVFPETSKELVLLPGVGPYTAAAIASFSYREVVAVVDGNVLRLMARLYAIEDDIRAVKTQNRIRELASQYIDKSRPDLYNHAIMDFGSMVCTPKPDCEQCPLNTSCLSFLNGLQEQIPFKSPSKKQRHRYFTYLIFKNHDTLAMKQRSTSDIWANLYDFYLLESDCLDEMHTIEDPALDEIEVKNVQQSTDYKHVLSHQIIHARFILIETAHLVKIPNLTYYSEEEILNLPKPVLIDNFLTDYFNTSTQNDNFKES